MPSVTINSDLKNETAVISARGREALLPEPTIERLMYELWDDPRYRDLCARQLALYDRSKKEATLIQGELDDLIGGYVQRGHKYEYGKRHPAFKVPPSPKSAKDLAKKGGDYY